MRTRQVPSAKWRSTLDDLSRSFSGALVSLEVVGGVQSLVRFLSPARPELFDRSVE